MKLFVVSCLIASQAFSQPSKRASEDHGEEECCMEKTVGGILYKLNPSKNLDKAMMERYNCLNGCIYNTAERPGPSFCFARGDLVVECKDGFKWCYEGECGVDKWAEHIEACGGDRQSPIDVRKTSGPPVSQPLRFEGYEKLEISMLSSEDPDHLGGKDDRFNGMVSNNGHTAVLSVRKDNKEENGIVSGGPLNSDEYVMLQLHFHWGANNQRGSEHTIDGKEFPMEMHIVHIKRGLTIEQALAAPDGLAVVGQMFEITDDDNRAIQPLVESLKQIRDYKGEFAMDDVDLKVVDLLPKGGTYANYPGSLTTPPCSEAVVWLLYLDPIPISARQMDSFRELEDSHGGSIVDNFRPPLDLNGREVKFFE